MLSFITAGLMSALHLLSVGDCEVYWTTGYLVSEFPGLTADGSTTTTAAMARGEKIVAASYNLPFDTRIVIDDVVGIYRVADRGMLGPRHIDVLVSTLEEAYALTGWRSVCIVTE